MKSIAFIFTLFVTLTITNTRQEYFSQYSYELLAKIGFKSCPNPNFYIETANIEESKSENSNKIILYHGESYGSWLFQLILKAFMFPEADEDWLPLRYKPLKKDIDRTDLMKMINVYEKDDSLGYKELGLSVSPNLVSNYYGESAWHFICDKSQYRWSKLAGLSLDDSLHSSMYNIIKMKFIPENLWENFKRQKKILYQFIQIKRGLLQKYDTSLIYENIERLFPKTFNDYRDHLKFLESDLVLEKDSNKFNFEGVALQIIMDKELADSLTYSSHSYGWVKSKTHKDFHEWKRWKGEEIEPYSEVYQEVKNKLDFNQARLALNNDFRVFPSRVIIKSIAGIMEHPVDYRILKSMIQEMAEVNKKEKIHFLDYFFL